MKVCEERVQTGNFPRVSLEGSVIAIVPKHQKNTLRATESIKRGARFTSVQVNTPRKHGWITSWRKQGLSVSPVSPFEMQKLGQILHKITQDWLKRAKQIKRQTGADEAVVFGWIWAQGLCSTFTESFLISNRSYDYLESPLDSASLLIIERLIG